MEQIDLTNEAVTIEGIHFILSYALRKEKEELIALYDEMEIFCPEHEYSKFHPKVAFHFAFFQRVFRSEVNIVLIAASFIEAIANMFFSNKADSDTFSILEKATPIEKWVTLPKLYIPTYSLQKESYIYNTLKVLNTRRNSIVHSKPRITQDDSLLHKGNLFKKETNEYKLHLDFCELPYQLVQNLKTYDSHAGTELEIMCSLLGQGNSNYK